MSGIAMRLRDGFDLNSVYHSVQQFHPLPDDRRIGANTAIFSLMDAALLGVNALLGHNLTAIPATAAP